MHGFMYIDHSTGYRKPLLSNDYKSVEIVSEIWLLPNMLPTDQLWPVFENTEYENRLFIKFM